MNFFQISYRTSNYDDYYHENERYLDTFKFRDQEIDYFLKHYGYYEKFMNLNVHPDYAYHEMAIKTDVLRLAILYELGGIYLDSDILFTKHIKQLETDLIDKFGDLDLITEIKSLYFIKASKKSQLIKTLLCRYLEKDMLILDTLMLKKLKLKPSFGIVSQGFLKKYFNHAFVGVNK